MTRQTHCKRGHRLSGKNLYIRPDGHRQCKTCNALRAKVYLRRKRCPDCPSTREPCPRHGGFNPFLDVDRRFSAKRSEGTPPT